MHVKSHCPTSDKLPTIKDLSLNLQNPSGPKVIVDKALGKTFWTKDTSWSNISLKASSNYKPEIDSARKPNYISRYLIGIADMQIVITLERGADKGEWTISGECSNFDENCDKSVNEPIRTIPQWKKVFNGNFNHNDRIKFRVSAKNGGKVFYEDRSANKPYPERQYLLNGIATEEVLFIGFDVLPPVHCFEQSNDCTQDALTATDFLTQPMVTVQWDGWTDNDSGIDRYEFLIYYLVAKTPGAQLTNGESLDPISSNQSSITLDLKDPGPYSIEITVFDRAGNYKTARRIVFFDNASVVNLSGEKPRIVQAQENGWINKYSDTVDVVWPGRFRNIRHSNGEWLNDVHKNDHVSRDLDDREGRSSRTVEKIDNIEGIIRFEIADMVEVNNHSKYTNYTQVPEEYFHLEKMVYNDEDFIDGKRLTYFIRGVDAVGQYAEDNVTVMIDLSPPKIQNLWLTKGDLVNISVHSVLELKELTIEWEAFDYHSGIHEVSWKIFDNFTKNVVVHGQSHEPPQGETKTLNECKRKYGKYPRGPNCYCSPYDGCFHKHYQIKPPVSNGSNGGLEFGKEIGEHDYDYFIEVTVRNIAGLTTVQHKKITIDTSPPHEGIVHDGISGDPEVDFQQFLQLAGHWDGFFDKESGVWFYSYGFSERCLNENDLHLKVNWTYDSRAEFTVTKSGKYYLTVMAYNHALGNSKPVCSDGVTIDVMPAVVSEVVVKDAVTASGLVKSDVDCTVYILHRNRELEKVRLPSKRCRNRATPVSDSMIELYPHKRRSNRTMSFVILNDNCNDLHGVHSDLISYITSGSK
ncbi:uncharacterized protein LOC128551785, partial [Mercenaria mercenaria]|uniref:uncharacterized protein LOC128551785 n=1 Tax=Mercenaria mercenaria TaxID=6596 RepID=UPI00234F4B72